MDFPHLSRRGALGAAWSMFASASIPRFASAAPARDPRLVIIVLRGALDGLSAVAPIGDPDYADLHKELALFLDRSQSRSSPQQLFRPPSRDEKFRAHV